MGSISNSEVHSAERLVRLHCGVIRAVAALRKCDVGSLIAATESGLQGRLSEFLEFAAGTNKDREQALSLALAAVCAASESRKAAQQSDFSNPLPLAKQIDSLRSDNHKDALFGIYWNKETIEEVAEAEQLKPLTIAQNRKRAEKELRQRTQSPIEVELEKWLSREPGRGPVSDKPEDLIEAAFGAGRRSVSPAGCEAIVDAMAARARTYALAAAFSIRPRSANSVAGRPHIIEPPRLGLYEIEQMVAMEERDTYDRTRTYTFSNPPEGWEVQVVHIASREGPHQLNLALKSPAVPIVVTDEGGDVLGVCDLDRPFLMLAPSRLPFEFSIRGAVSAV